MEILKESGHWYDREGRPAYEVPNKSKGGMRPTTIADARKLDLVPSVTTVMKVMDKPALTNWKIEQAISACISMPFDGADEAQYRRDIYEAAFGEDATGRDRGTEIHGAVEQYLAGNEHHPLVEKYREWADVTEEKLRELAPREVWQPEQSFATWLGYGGKIDAVTKNQVAIVDIKTKDFSRGTPRAYDEHAMQLAAYTMGRFGNLEILAANVFLDRDTPKAHMHVWSSSELRHGWDAFRAALALWKTLKGF